MPTARTCTGRRIEQSSLPRVPIVSLNLQQAGIVAPANADRQGARWAGQGRGSGERSERTLDAPSAPAEWIGGATAASAPTELLNQPPNFPEVEEFAGPHHAHRVIPLPIKMARKARKFEDERRRVVLGREGRELQNAGVKDDSQGRVWRVAVPARVA